MTLIVGNPTNVYLAQSAGISFAQYFSVMVLPAITAGVVGLAMILLIFRKDLFAKTSTVSHNLMVSSPEEHVKIVKTPMFVAIAHLLVCIILLAVSDFIGLEMWLICLTFAFLLTVFDVIWNYIKYKSPLNVVRTLKKAPF